VHPRPIAHGKTPGAPSTPAHGVDQEDWRETGPCSTTPDDAVGTAG
jgi:hypothetical protein